MDPISSFFLGNEIIGTGKKTKQNIKAQMAAGSKYDAILGNKLVKAPSGDGTINAVNSNPLFRNASEELDFLCKAAEETSGSNATAPRNQSYNNRPYNNNRANNSYGNRNSNYSRPNRNYQSNRPQQPSMPINLVEIKEKNYHDNDEGFNPYLVAGGAVLGAGLLQGLAKKNPMAPVQSAKKGLDKFVHKLPRKILGKNKSMKTVMDVVKDGTKDVRNEKINNARNVSRKLSQEHSNMRRDMGGLLYSDGDIYDALHNSGKQASVVLDEVFEKSASIQSKVQDTISKVRPKAKQMVRDDFLRAGLESIPYYGAPALAGFVAGKNIFDPAVDPNVERVVVDFPLSSLQKQNKPRKRKTTGSISKQAYDAGIELGQIPQPRNIPWGEWAKETLPKKALQGLSRSIFPALFIATTGRNLKGRLEKLEQKEDSPKSQPIPDGIARVTIETKKAPEIKTASEELDYLFKIASGVIKDIEEKVNNVDIDKLEQKKLNKQDTLTNYDGLKSGMSKQYHMVGLEE
ncbi:MAG: hypothetical protein K0R00_133 [Herbinix sp.]|jgi:hypothetical protein|nr:hypothetical protein [Herbinix sp.]